MTRVFAQQVHYARVTEGWSGVLRVWARSVVDLLATAPGEHVAKEALVPEPVVRLERAMVGHDRVTANNWTLAALLPIWTLLALGLIAPNFISAIFLSPPAILGPPAGLVGLALCLAWAGIGVALVRRTASPTARIVTFVLFAIPPTFGIFMLPAAVLILLNLTT